MGNNNSDLTETEFRQEWRIFETSGEVVTWENKRNPNRKVYQHRVRDGKAYTHQSLHLLRKTSPYLVNALVLQNEGFSCTMDSETNKIYVEAIRIRLSELEDIPYPDVFHLYRQCLNGYMQLTENVGHFCIDEDQIGVNEEGIVKVWCNSQYQYDLVVGTRIGEAQMVRQLLNILASKVNQESCGRNPNIAWYIGNHEKITFREAWDKFQQYIQEFHSGKTPERMDCIYEHGGVYSIRKWINRHEGVIDDSKIVRVYDQQPKQSVRGDQKRVSFIQEPIEVQRESRPEERIDYRKSEVRVSQRRQEDIIINKRPPAEKVISEQLIERPRVIEQRSVVEPERPVMMRSEIPRVENREIARFVSPPTQSVRVDAPRVLSSARVPNRDYRVEAPRRQERAEIPQRDVRVEAPRRQEPQREVRVEAPRRDMRVTAPQRDVRVEAPRQEPRREVRVETAQRDMRSTAPAAQIVDSLIRRQPESRRQDRIEDLKNQVRPVKPSMPVEVRRNDAPRPVENRPVIQSTIQPAQRQFRPAQSQVRNVQKQVRPAEVRRPAQASVVPLRAPVDGPSVMPVVQSEYRRTESIQSAQRPASIVVQPQASQPLSVQRQASLQTPIAVFNKGALLSKTSNPEPILTHPPQVVESISLVRPQEKKFDREVVERSVQQTTTEFIMQNGQETVVTESNSNSYMTSVETGYNEPKLQQQRVISQTYTIKEEEPYSAGWSGAKVKELQSSETNWQDYNKYDKSPELSNIGRPVPQSFNYDEEKPIKTNYEPSTSENKFIPSEDGKSSAQFLAFLTNMGTSDTKMTTKAEQPSSNYNSYLSKNQQLGGYSNQSKLVSGQQGYSSENMSGYGQSNVTKEYNYEASYQYQPESSANVVESSSYSYNKYESKIDPELEADLKKYQ